MAMPAVWSDLMAQAAKMKGTHLRTLMQDQARNESMFVKSSGMVLDYCREKVDAETMSKLFALAEKADVDGKKKQMYSGVKINPTEGRPVLHVALRAARDTVIDVDGTNVVPEVWKVLDAMKAFSEKVRSGSFVGHTGKPLTDVVCIGIGGSYLGVEFVFEALRTDPEAAEMAKGRRLRFLANVDPIDTKRCLEGLSAETTLVVIVSKTFTTAETMLNAKTVKEWLIKELGTPDCISKHVAACSTALDKTKAFGIDEANVFGFWDWVGGRFSCSSAVGILPLALQYGFEVTEQFLAGLRDMDDHFRTAPFEKNLPVLMGLLSNWNATFLGFYANALLPYCQALAKLAPHIQQVSMESNGKRVMIDGTGTEGSYQTGEVIFGEPGTNGQHSFYQLIHQGRLISCDFIGLATGQQEVYLPGEEVSNHDELMCNYFAQADALACGKTAEELRAEGVKEELVAHKTFPGNRPSYSLLLPKLGPFEVGQLLALYEHRIAVQGCLWGVNSFDQWGVELGKVLAKKVRTCLAAARKDGKPLAEAAAPFNYSTKRLLSKYMEQVKEEAGEESYSALFDSPFAFFCPGLEGAEADPKNPQYKKAKI